KISRVIGKPGYASAMRGTRENCAVTVLFVSMSRLRGFCVPLASPLQPKNCCPSEGVAVRVIVLPIATLFVCGLADAVPPPCDSTVIDAWPDGTLAKSALTVCVGL